MIAGARWFIDAPSQGDRHKAYAAMLAADQKEARSFLHPHLSSLVKGTTQERFGRRVVEDEGARRIRQEKRGYQVTGELAR